MKKYQLPFGVQEYLPGECSNKTATENMIAEVFYSAGYERVETAALEYFELYDGIMDKNAVNRMFKMTDNDGSLLVLRPDPTVQVCRMASLRTGVSVGKYFYIENSFEYLPDTASARTREFSQIGLELLGKSGAGGDAEVIVLAIEALLKTGLKNFLIDIGHMGFFYGLTAQYGFGTDDAKKIAALVDRKDTFGIEMFLEQRKTPESVKAELLSLTTLFGGEEILDKAAKLCGNEMSFNAVKNIRAVIDTLKAYGYEKYASVDFGMLKGGYYTGIIFRGIAEGQGLPILDGGRYDNLCGVFNTPMEAVGFAIGIKRLLKALDSQGSLIKPAPCDIAYITLDGITKAVVNEIAALKKVGKRVTRLFIENEDELVRYCVKNSIKTAHIFKNGKRIIKEIE